MKDALADVLRTGRFTQLTSYQRFGYMVGALLILSGVFHGVVYLVDGGAWAGPLS